MKGHFTPHSTETKNRLSEINKGKKHSEATRLKMSNSHKGKNTWSKGRKLTDEHKKKVSDSLLGNQNSLGYKHSKETSKKWSELRKGRNHYNWQGGINSINDTIRHSFEIKEWRTAVFERDDYTCVLCGVRGGNLEADHIKPFSAYPELRCDLDNGRTLCVPCHKTTDTYGGKCRRELTSKVS